MSVINTAREGDKGQDAGRTALDRRGVRDEWCLLLLGVTWVAVWYRQVFLSVTTFVGDTAWVFFPLRALGAARLREGELGLWNPHVFGGVPFAADPQSQVFYPSHALLTFLSVPAAMSASLALHSLLLLAGSYLLGRCSLRLRPASAAVFALAFGLCAPALERTTIPVYAEALAWLPWAVLALDWSLRGGRWARLWAPATLVAVQLMAGAPQYTYYTLIVMVGVAAWRVVYGHSPAGRLRAALSLPTVLAGAALLSAIQVLPMVEMVRLTQRAADLGYGFATYGSLPLRAFAVTLLFPRLYGTCVTPETGAFQVNWYLGYVGLATLGLAVIGACLSPRRKQVWWLVVLLVLTLAIATGSHNPLFPLLFRAVPGVALFRTPSSIIVLTDLALAALAGLGLETVWMLPQRRRWVAVGVAAMPAAAASVGARWALRTADWLLPVTFPMWPWWQVGIAMAGSGAVSLAFAFGRRGRWAAALPGAALVCLAADLAAFSSATDIAAVVPNEVLTSVPETVAYQRARRPLDRRWEVDPGVPLRKYLSAACGSSMSEMTYRISAARYLLELLPSDLPAAYQVDGLNGAWGAMLPLKRHVPAIYQGRIGSPERQWLDLLGVAYFADRGHGQGLADCPVVLTTEIGVLLHENLKAAPRAFWSATGVPVPDLQTAVLSIEQEIPFPYQAKVYVEGPEAPVASVRAPALAAGAASAEAGGSGGGASGSVRVATRDAERVVMTVRADSEGWVVFSENHYPGWRARLDGANTPLFPANGVMRAVRVPKGEHRVEMDFYSESLKLGGFMSLTGLALLVGTLYAQAVPRGSPGSDRGGM